MLEQLNYLDPPEGSDHAALEFSFIFSIKITNLNKTVLLYVKHPYKMVRMSRKLNKVKIGFEINLYF